MPNDAREADCKRRRAYAEGVIPKSYARSRGMPDGTRIEAHEVELAALARIAAGEQSAWDALAAEALGGRCFDAGCAIADGDVGGCPGWCAVALEGFAGWVMAS